MIPRGVVCWRRFALLYQLTGQRSVPAGFAARWFSSAPGNDSSFRTVTLDTPAAQEAKKTRPKPNLTVIFELENGTELVGRAAEGDTLLDVVINNQLDLDGFGACEGTLACSTCHLILSPEDFARIPNPVSDEEMDMLDLASGLTETSRLGCQIHMTKQLDGLRVKVPSSVNDVRLT